MALALFGLKKPICILIKIYIYNKISKTIFMIFQKQEEQNKKKNLRTIIKKVNKNSIDIIIVEGVPINI